MFNSKASWIGIIALAAIASFLVVKYFFPQIIEQFAAGILALLALLAAKIFGKKKA